MVPNMRKILGIEYPQSTLDAFSVSVFRIHATSYQGELRKRVFENMAILANLMSSDGERIGVAAFVKQIFFTRGGQLLYFKNVEHAIWRLRYFVDDLYMDTIFQDPYGESDDEGRDSEVCDKEIVSTDDPEDTIFQDPSVESGDEGSDNEERDGKDVSADEFQEDDSCDDRQTKKYKQLECNESYSSSESTAYDSSPDESSAYESGGDDNYEPVQTKKRHWEAIQDSSSDENQPLAKKLENFASTQVNCSSHAGASKIVKGISDTPPTLSSPLSLRLSANEQKKRLGWSDSENFALTEVVKEINQKQELCDMKLFDVVSRVLENSGIHRSAVACKNQWNRVGRAASGYDERCRGNKSILRTSVQ